MTQAPQAPHARTHMTNQGINRAPLPALLPTILAGLFILAGCGGGALPIPVIATESTDVANNLETRAPDSIFLSVDEQPPVEKQEEEQVAKQVQDPAPVFEVAVAPALPPQRSFSQSPPEPQTSTETVTRSDATGESNHDDGIVTFADWVASFGAGNAPPTQAETQTITITSTYAYPESRTTGHQRVVYGTVYADGATEPIYAESDLAQLTPTYAVDDTAQMHPIYAESDLAQLTPTNAIGQKILGNAATSFKDENGFLTDLDGGELILTTRVRATDRDGNPLSHTNGDPIMIDKPIELSAQLIGHINAQAMIESTLEDVTPTRTRTKVAGVKNEFLQGGAGGRLDETPRDAGPAGQVSNRGSLNLATATFDGRKLGGDAADGVAFFRGFDDIPESQDPKPHEPTYTHSHAGLAHNYAGLYSGTDLGAPVSESGSASWNGRIRTIGWFNFDTDFTLRVNFGTKKLNVSRLINPQNKNQWLQITNAEYDENGVVSGTIIIDEDMEDRGIQAQYGFLSGLIGAEGAVVAFLSSGTNHEDNDATSGTKEDITDGSHRFGFAGGFVARPGIVANTDVRIDAWTGGFDNPLPRGAKKHTLNQDDTPLNQFLLRDDPAKRPSWKKTEGGSLSLSALGGDATDGVDFFPAVITIYGYNTSGTSQNYFAGLWDSTNLGAPIPLSTNFNNEASAMWKGKFSVFQGANARFDTDFMLEVDFINNGVRTVTAIEAGAEDYYLSGRYIANGLMTGVVRRAANANNSSPKNGLISGLIGQEGLVAAFVSNIGGSGMDAENRDTIKGGTGDTGYAGGFVASPISPPPPLDVVDVSDIKYTYTRNFVHIEKPRNIETDGVEARDEIRTETEVSSDINYADIPTTVAGLADTPNPNSRFLRIEGLNIDSRGLTNPVIHTRRLDYTAGSAGFGDGYVIIDPHGYAAILPTTNLGAARPVGAGQPTDARWNGMYSLSGNGAFAPNTPINFDINFETGNLTGTAPLANSLTDDITIEATFGADGVMSGTFSTDKVFRDDKNEVYTIPQVNTNVIGLIGEEGLVGIMHGNIILGTKVTGGFVASPN